VKSVRWPVTQEQVHVAVVVVGVLANLGQVLGALVNTWHQPAWQLLFYTPIEVLVGWTFLFVGLIAGRRRPGNPVGLLISLFGLLWPASALGWINSPWPYEIGDMLKSAFLVVLAHLYIVYPHGRAAGRLEKGAIVTVYAWYALATLSLTLTYLPTAWGCTLCPQNPFYIPGTAWLNQTMQRVTQIGTLVVAVGVLGIFIWHWRHASAPVRRAMAPAAWSAVPVFAIVVAWQSGFEPQWLVAIIGPVEWVAYMVLPIGLLVGVLRTRLGRAAVTDMVINLNRLPTSGKLRDMLARALGDPSLELALALPGGGYVDSNGRSLELPPPGSARAVTAIESDGKPLAALIHDPAVDEEDPGLVAAAGSAARLALENERLQAEVRASLDEVRASRARILEAADVERRRLERDIHDGAQQRLVALGLAIRMARDQAATHGDKALVTDLEGAANQLQQAITELRELARGIHPAVLSRAGIGPALRVLAELSPIPVDLTDVAPGRYREAVEAAVYFVVSEALTNAAKHSGAQRVEVSVRRTNDQLSVDVRDDGSGGAKPDGGSGLVGMADRVAVLGGRIEVSSPQGAGTLVHAEIPCG
jgi:signal transduction histidine kinase